MKYIVTAVDAARMNYRDNAFDICALRRHLHGKTAGAQLPVGGPVPDGSGLFHLQGLGLQRTPRNHGTIPMSHNG